MDHRQRRLALHGLDPGTIGDIDLLMSARDAAALLAAQDVVPAPGIPDDRFRSVVFGRWSAGDMTVETMGGFELHGPSGWRPVIPSTREAIPCGDAILFVPSRSELGDLLRRFGRPKDRVRAELLDQPSPRSAGPNACGSSSLSR